MLPRFAVKAKNLSKLYQLGAESGLDRTLRDALANSVRRIKPRSKAGNDAASSQFWALENVSFEIQPGEIIGVIGRNGAGKSTLLKILSRITEPTAGRAELFGRIGSLLEVGTGFHPELSGRENIFLNGSILGMSNREIARKFDEIVAFAEIEQFIDTPVKRYSSGMYVRLAFAVAAHLEPEILLVDEVLAVGDAAFQKKCLGKLGEVSKAGRTILFVSHNTAALLGLCSRGLLFERGKLTADGEIESVVHSYLKSLRANALNDLSSFSNREGKGRVRITSVAFEDELGHRIENGISGQPLVIKLNYRATETKPLPNCRASIAFYDNLGQTLFNCSSELAIRDPITLAPNGEIRCVIPRLPLSQNHYLLSLFLEVNREIEDWIHQGVELPVVDGDFYGTGRLYPEGWRGKGVLVNHQWIME
ncbi:MAG: ABC transporter ATP-binding protein [Acidobacteriota bacterium]